MSSSTTIVFACKSNSCRSQLAEGWAREWIKEQRLGLENRAKTRFTSRDEDDHDRQLRAFLDGLLVASVALDESSVSGGGGSKRPSAPLSSSPTSSLATSFSGSRAPCVTCDGELCTLSPTSPSQRRKPKEKAIQAMAQDGVDISSYYAKSFKEVLPLIANSGSAAQDRPIDKLRVLCSCPDSMKCPLSNLSKETLDWDIDPPTAAARSEGDGAYLRVSRQIKGKVDSFMDELKRCAFAANDKHVDGCNFGVDTNENIIDQLLPVST